MSYTRFLTPDPIHTFNASHTDAEVKAWQAEQSKSQLELPLESASAQPASTTDFEKSSVASENPTELDSTQPV